MMIIGKPQLQSLFCLAGKEDESNIFVRLLQNQVLNYQSKPRDKKKESKMKKKRAPPPPSPTPDYLQEDTNPRKPREKDLLSKSVSSLLTDKKTEDKVRMEKKISGINLSMAVVEVVAIYNDIRIQPGAARQSDYSCSRL